MSAQNLILSPYDLVLKEIREGKIDPYDVDVEYLARLFKETAEKLEDSEYLREAGRFLEASASLLKLQIATLFPSSTKKITIKEVKEVLLEEKTESDYDLSFLYDYSPKIGRPAGSGSSKPRNTEPVKAEVIPLHRQVDYKELAKEVRRKILEGKFKVNTITDFIAYLFAYFEFEDVPELSF